jgi:hypothetical protein
MRRAGITGKRDDIVDLFRDAFRYFEDLDAHPERALRHLGSPFATRSCQATRCRPATAMVSADCP